MIYLSYDAMLRERLLANAIIDSETGCWKWTGNKTAGGYGLISVDGRSTTTQRASYELFVGPIPAGLEIDHLCHTNDLTCPGGPSCAHRQCVNPAHLEAVTHEENQRRAAVRKSRCPQGHEYTPENTRTDRGQRQCRTCGRERQALYRQQNPEKVKTSKRSYEQRKRTAQKAADQASV